MYTDDTVILYSDKSAKAAEDVINHEANLVGKWFTDNNLIMNLKKGKTEFVMYGTSQNCQGNHHAILKSEVLKSTKVAVMNILVSPLTII